jgi:lipoate-protein ligase A
MPEHPDPTVQPFTWDDALIESALIQKIPQSACYPFPYPAIVAGKGSSLSREIRFERILRDHIPVYRRQGGGCAVFLDKGCLIVSTAFPAEGFSGIRSLFSRCTHWLIKGLNRTGINGIYPDGISDLVVDNHKIGGSCLKRSKGFVYFSVSILVSADLDMMGYCLKHPPREPEYRKGRAHHDFVRNLSHYYHEITVQDLSLHLGEALKPAFQA